MNNPMALEAIHTVELRDIPHHAADFLPKNRRRLPVFAKMTHISGRCALAQAVLTITTVIRVRSKLAAFAVAAILAVSASGSVFAQAAHPECVAKQHDCGNSAKISPCCCGEQDTSNPSSPPAQPHFELRADIVALPVVPNAPPIIGERRSLHAVHTSPPRGVLLDLPTLYVTFLI